MRFKKGSLMLNHDFDKLLSIQGQIFREQKNRKTLKFIENNQAYFIKIHLGTGYKEIIKNLFQLKTPVIGAANEVNALIQLKHSGFVPELAGYGFQGKNPVTLKSYVITKAIENYITLEDYCQEWSFHPPRLSDKRRLIQKVADIAREIHQQGINHRDFYLCHFLLHHEFPKTLQLTVIDWHRAQLRSRVPYRWRVKDIAGLYFSALDCGLTQRDLYLFRKVYQYNDQKFWHDVENKALKLYKKFREKKHHVFTKKNHYDNPGAAG